MMPRASCGLFGWKVLCSGLSVILFHTLVSSPGWQVLSASQLAAYRVVTRAVNVNLLLILMFANFRGVSTTVAHQYEYWDDVSK